MALPVGWRRRCRCWRQILELVVPRPALAGLGFVGCHARHAPVPRSPAAELRSPRGTGVGRRVSPPSNPAPVRPCQCRRRAADGIPGPSVDDGRRRSRTQRAALHAPHGGLHPALLLVLLCAPGCSGADSASVTMSSCCILDAGCRLQEGIEFLEHAFTISVDRLRRAVDVTKVAFTPKVVVFLRIAFVHAARMVESA